MVDPAGPGHDAVRVARLLSVAALTVEVAVLVVTGLWLVFFYRPSASAAWQGMPHLATSTGGSGFVRGFHHLVAALAVPTAVIAGLFVVVDSRTRRAGWRRGRLAVVCGPALVVVILGASFTGFLLPWNQLALWAVSAGSDLRGYITVFGPRVKFVIVGHTEVTKSTLWRWFLLHTVLIPALLGAMLYVAWRPCRREPTDVEPTDVEPTDGEPTDVEPTDGEPTDGEPTDTRVPTTPG